MAHKGPDVKPKSVLPEYESDLPGQRYVNRSGHRNLAVGREATQGLLMQTRHLRCFTDPYQFHASTLLHADALRPVVNC